METSDRLTGEEQVLFGAYNVAADLAVRCRQLAKLNASTSERALEMVVNTFMTELWDQSFSQAEIRSAFTTALADMNRYAAGQDPR